MIDSQTLYYVIIAYDGENDDDDDRNRMGGRILKITVQYIKKNFYQSKNRTLFG
jgi:hypothetical protein